MGIIKIQAHTKDTSEEAKGNAYADTAAKQAALLEVTRISLHTVCFPEAPISLDVLTKLQAQVSSQEKNAWTQSGATLHDNLWKDDVGKLCLPQVLFPMLVSTLHSQAHLSKGGVQSVIQKTWIAPGITTAINKHTQQCMMCAKHNPGIAVKTPVKSLPKAEYPFQRLQIDYIQLPKTRIYEYVLVCLDMFSGWPEAWSVAKATEKLQPRNSYLK